jgi:hypothetical protein
MTVQKIEHIGSIIDAKPLPLLVTQREARRLLSIGTTKYYDLVRRGLIRTSTKTGRRMVVRASLTELIEGDRG